MGLTVAAIGRLAHSAVDSFDGIIQTVASLHPEPTGARATMSAGRG